MGLIDVLSGMQNGPHGQRDPSATGSSSSGGMSPITMPILGLLAYKAVKGFAGNQPSTAPANTRIPPTPNPTSPGQSGQRYFFSDASGVIRYSNTAPATSADGPLQ